MTGGCSVKIKEYYIPIPSSPMWLHGGGCAVPLFHYHTSYTDKHYLNFHCIKFVYIIVLEILN